MKLNHKAYLAEYILKLVSISIFILLVNGSTELMTSPTSVNTLPTTIRTQLDPINGTNNFRIYGGKKSKEEKHWLDGRGLGMHHVQCVRKGNCEKLNFLTCLGAKIPYGYTSLDLTISHSQADVHERLKKYMALRHVPKCWSVIQPFLCAFFTPKCENINGEDMVYLPSLEMCRITLEPCRILYNTSYFPEFLNCNETQFPSKCNNDVREMKFNLTGQCLEPLVPAESSARYHPGVEGCGVGCKDPLYTDDERRQIHKLVGWGATLCFLVNLFVVATFIIDWKNANKYPAVIVFYINACFMFACFGFLAQFIPGSREDIVCRKDGTLRQSEPTAGENLSCVVIFFIVNYFVLAAMFWFIILTYAWYLKAVGNAQDRIDKKVSYFHLAAWSLPLVLTITIMALSEVDGNSTVGICFAGYINQSIRAGTLLGPLSVVILVGGYFIIRGMNMLFRLKRFAYDIKSTSAINKIKLITVGMGVRAFLSFFLILVSIVCHVYEFLCSDEWIQSLKDYITCRIFSPFEEHIKCKIENRPSISVLQLHLVCFFGAGIVMSTWCYTPSSVETWKRYFTKKYGKDVNAEVKMPKHKVIAQTWAKRKEFEDKGRLSITLYNTHTDPVGLNFDVNDLNSSETNEISSTWANYLPQFVKRRMALTGATEATNSSSQGPRKNSLDSEISFSVRHVSVESRRNSVDSQVSVKIQEMKTKVAARSRTGHHHHHAKQSISSRKRSQRRRDCITATGRKYSGRRESSTSLESQVIALKKTTFPNASHKLGLFAHSSNKHNSTKRRSANAGLDPADITEFLVKNGQLIIPFLQNQGMTTTSDEEISMASFKIKDSRVDVVLKQDVSESDEEEAIMIANKNKKQAAYEILLKNMQKSNDSGNNRNSRNSTRSRQSRKSQAGSSSGHKKSLKRHNNSNVNSQKHKTLTNSKYEMDLINSSDLNLHLKREISKATHTENSLSEDSFSSLDLDLPPNLMLHSSYSGISTGKPNSRNSKTSCDVGIQANAFEIATQTLQSSCGDGEFEKCIRQINNKCLYHKNNHYNEDDDDDKDAMEMHSLLGGKHRESAIILSEAEKLKMLLLPSK